MRGDDGGNERRGEFDGPGGGADSAAAQRAAACCGQPGKQAGGQRSVAAGAAVAQMGDIAVVVGPEGGLTDDELAAFAEVGGQVVGLGPTVLRSSSAGIVAAALVLSRTSRWG